VTTASPDGGLGPGAQPWPRASRRAARARPVAGAWARPLRAADVAQARLFDEILQSEVAALEDLAESAERHWLGRQPGSGDEKPPEALLRARDHAAEAQRLLSALRERFPHD
jgi:hypothetical protein